MIDPELWNVTPKQAVELQNRLREKVSLADDLGEVCTVGGVDVSIARFSKTGKCGIVVLSFPELEVIETRVHISAIEFPYVPGLLAFRELPIFFQTWDQLAAKPDLLFFDGQGYAHPRRFGLACMAGVLLNKPTVGCAKSRLVGEYAEPPQEPGAVSPLIAAEGDRIGDVVRTKAGCKPVFISPGHRISFETATALALGCTRGYRIPEPTRLAHIAVTSAL